MWFRNLCIFRLEDPYQPTPAALEEDLRRWTLAPCSGLSERSRGWVSPQEDDALVVAIPPQLLISFGEEKKLLPASVINDAARDKARAFEAERGFPAGRRQLREFKESVTTELLPRAFVRRRRLGVWIDTQSGWLIVDSAQLSLAEDVVELFRDSAAGAPRIRPWDTELSPVAAMTRWLSTGTAPGRFSIDDECELRGSDATRATVRYLRHSLDGEEIRRHISAGKQATRLAMSWNDRISFVLTEELQLKRIKLIDVEADSGEAAGEDAQAQFDADFLLMTGEIGALLGELAAALESPLPGR